MQEGWDYEVAFDHILGDLFAEGDKLVIGEVLGDLIVK